MIQWLKNNDDLTEYEISFYLDVIYQSGFDFSKESLTTSEYEELLTDYCENRQNIKHPYRTCARPSMRSGTQRFERYMDMIFDYIKANLVKEEEKL
jgi:hypothetical protein